ncbi:MAG: asparaginase domain-containing protein [Synergistaceae bacterium]|nr:asparaginase domain-containing protein [Synergistaceae bacterium]
MANRDKIALILAGGQIIQKHVPIELETRVLEEEEIVALFPEAMREKIYIVDWSYQPISHYTLRMCSDMIQVAGAQVEAGASGIVITCGTQALTEMAYFSNLVWSYPQPLVFTASINYANSLGSETALFFSQSVRAAESRTCWGQGALVCLQDKLYPAAELVHLSNDNRNGYVAIPGGPVAKFSEPEGVLTPIRTLRRGKIMDITTPPARNVEILDASLGGGDVLLNALLDGRVSEVDGLVVSSFGGGDVPPSWVSLLRKVMRAEVPVVLASRCMAGRVISGLDFEGSAKRLLEMGLISAGDLMPLQARIRLAVGLGAELRDQDLRSYMLNE